MNVKRLALVRLNVLKPIEVRSIHARRNKNGTLYLVWRPKLPRGSVDVELGLEDRFIVMAQVTFHRSLVMGNITTYPGLSLISGFRLRHRKRRSVKV